PSTIGIDTLFRSQGRIPEVFLRGCGVPESLIEYLPSLLGAMQPIQFYSCFISYSAHDQAFAQRLYDRLQGQGLRVWFAPEELKGGNKLDEQIDTAIRTYDKLILVLSDASVRSKWVMHELRKARRAELANQRRKLFPIRLTSFETLHNWECFDPENGQDLADEVRQYFIPDFAQWKEHDRFEHEFGLLLAALKAVDDPPAPGPPPEKVIAYKQRELLKLRQQQATLGAHTPPHVLMKIEDIEGEIRALGGAVDE
ncbi:MAG TPA: toll/interleukin-1 receptor domain-containing protein, partial [Kouleothrix sp.]|nr:toll/interleukin-1 receptor domain-containing protein [Kouleothrix sp.]